MPNFGNVLMVGTGLMAGSLAKALRERGLCQQVAGYARRIEPLEKGIELGILDVAVNDLSAAIQQADLIVLGVPTLAVGQYMQTIAKHKKASAVVTDVASVKGDVVDNIISELGELPAWFVPGHPIAGAEHSGIEASNSQLYENHKVILTPSEVTDAQALALVQNLWQQVGAEVVCMDIVEHDKVLAATSHLPHALAFVLMDTLLSLPKKHDVFDFAAGGFRDFSRIASSHPVMWHDIMLANKAAILELIADYRQHLNKLEQLIETDNSDAILDIFTRAKAARDDFTQRLHNKLKSSNESY